MQRDIICLQNTNHVGPTTIVGLLEGSVLAGTETAVHRAGGRLQTATAQPLALGYVRHAIALLMHGQIAQIAEENLVGVLTLTIIAHATYSVLVDERLQQSKHYYLAKVFFTLSMYEQVNFYSKH